MRTSRSCLLAIALVAFGCALPRHAAAIDILTVTVNTPITVFEGTGSGTVPIAAGATPPGYLDMNVNAVISQSPAKVSGGTTTITVSVDLLSFTPPSVHVSSVFNLNLDLQLIDPDPGAAPNFVAGFPSVLTPLNPLKIEVEGDVGIQQILDALAALPPDATDAEILAAITNAASVTTTVTPAKYALGVDVGGGSEPDVLTLQTQGLDETLLSFDVTGGDLEDLLNNIDLGNIGSSILLDASIAVSGLSLTFTGEVFDATADPPFTLTFTNVTLATTLVNGELPEPSSLWLLLAAGVGLVALGRRRAGQEGKKGALRRALGRIRGYAPWRGRV